MHTHTVNALCAPVGTQLASETAKIIRAAACKRTAHKLQKYIQLAMSQAFLQVHSLVQSQEPSLKVLYSLQYPKLSGECSCGAI